jgi:hypothetical protein
MMQIDRPAAPSAIILSGTPAIRGWLLQQVLMAEVIGTPTENSTRVRIGNDSFDARSEIALHKGQILQVRVVATAPKVVLKIEPSLPGPSRHSAERGLAQTLPHQGSLLDSLSLLRILNRTSGMLARTTGDGRLLALSAPIDRLVQSLPTTQNLQRPSDLRAALTTAATTSESKLAKLAGPATASALALATSDLRNQLSQLQLELGLARQPSRQQSEPTDLRVRDAMRAASEFGEVRPREQRDRLADTARAANELIPRIEPEDSLVQRMSRLLDGAIARIQTHQLSNFATAELPAAPLIVEVPVRHHDRVDLWHFEFTGDERHEESGEHPQRAALKVRIQFDAQRSVSAELRASGDAVSVTLSSDDLEMQHMLGARLNVLKKNMGLRGLQVGHISITAADTRPAAARLPRRLIDDSA